jgi:NADPH2:quinone reductase
MPWRLAVWERLASDWKPAQLDSIVNRTITLQELPEACTALIEGSVQGRVLVKLA